jgi:hypothetical protein
MNLCGYFLLKEPTCKKGRRYLEFQNWGCCQISKGKNVVCRVVSLHYPTEAGL